MISLKTGGRKVSIEGGYQSTGVGWGGYGTFIGGTSTAVGTGAANTTAIVNALGSGTYAAKICYDLVLNGCDDWFLPSSDELNLMYQNLKVAGIGGFADAYFWSSSEYSSLFAWKQNFDVGYEDGGDKGYSFHVRAVRAF